MPFADLVSARVAILVNPVSADSTLDAADVLKQAEAVGESLRALGYRTSVVDFSPNLDTLSARIQSGGCRAVFNLVEEVAGQNRLQYLAPALLEVLGVPYTGNSPESLLVTTDKVLAKKVMKASGIPTPDWLAARPGQPASRSRRARQVIFKPIYEDASVGISEDLIGSYTPSQALERLTRLESETGMSYFAESFVEGREFNVSLLEVGGSPTVLPVVEQIFNGYPEGMPRVVGYRAKWVEGSFEFANTLRHHAFTEEERKLIEKIHAASVACWRAFGLSGYARVDFRVDGEGRPWVLEVNANPCLSPDAGFLYAARLAGLTAEDTVRLILAGLKHSGPWRSPSPGPVDIRKSGRRNTAVK